eukprot:4841545-Lingulodinium_polyedra.AAC.1
MPPMARPGAAQETATPATLATTLSRMITRRTPGRAASTDSTRAAQLASQARPLSPGVLPAPWP